MLLYFESRRDSLFLDLIQDKRSLTAVVRLNVTSS